MKELREKYSNIRLAHVTEFDDPIHLHVNEELGIVFPKTHTFFGWVLKKRPIGIEVVVAGDLHLRPSCWKMLVLKGLERGEYVLEFENVNFIKIVERARAKLIIE